MIDGCVGKAKLCNVSMKIWVRYSSSSKLDACSYTSVSLLVLRNASATPIQIQDNTAHQRSRQKSSATPKGGRLTLTSMIER